MSLKMTRQAKDQRPQASDHIDTISPSPRSQVRGGQTQFTQAARGGLRSAIRAPSSLVRWRVVRPELGNLAGCVNGQLPGVPLFNIIIMC